MKLFYCLLLLLCAYAGKAQELKIGDSLPYTAFASILNGPVDKSDTYASKGKLLVLDFMATNCPGCVAALPAIDSLQKIYKDELRVFLVTAEKQEKIVRFLQRHKGDINTQLPFILNDTILGNYFPHQYISHVVWISPQQKVKAITPVQYLNVKTIKEMLEGSRTAWPVKRDFLTYDHAQTLLSVNENNVPEPSLPGRTFYSAWLSFMPNLHHGWKQLADSAEGSFKTTYLNLSLAEMLQHFYGAATIPKSHYRWMVDSIDHYVYNGQRFLREDWFAQHGWCYEQVAPLTVSKKEREEKLIADIGFYLGLHISRSILPATCWVLRDTAVAGQAIQNPVAGKTFSLQHLLYLLNDRYTGIPVIDARLHKTDVLLAGTPDIDNLQRLQELLLKYGLALTPELQETEMLLIAQKR